MIDRSKHGTSKYRLNQLTSLASGVLENVTYIKTIWELSKQKKVHDDIADNEIRAAIEETDRLLDTLKTYLEYREDMNPKGETNGED